MKKAIEHIIVTGGAGFIGSLLVEKLLALGYTVTVIDNFDPFYDRSVKEKNIHSFISNPSCTFLEMDIVDDAGLNKMLNGEYDAIIHLAAKAGVRPSILDPIAYQEVNVRGTQNLLEFARKKNISQFVFASSSSVYGINKNYPWKEEDTDLNPISPYASTKISGELMGHVYSHLYGIRFIALRFFTVFGPRQRPDLAIHLFSKKILKGEPIDFFGNGSTRRDYTYVSDTVNGIINALHYDKTLFGVFNLGNHQTVSLTEMIGTLEEVFEKKAIINHLPEQMGDVPVTYADISKASKLLNYMPATSFKQGVAEFKKWLLAQ
jgi:UDP-glucuronate 4-epimerase